jgi:predicted transcriptional regulator
MRNLENRLKKELQQNIKAKILHSATWSIPIHSVEVEFTAVKRMKMDVLMKMMLIAFQKMEIAKAEKLSEILLVEQLFIQDLIEIMLKTRLIEKSENVYRLTDKGFQQLKNGVFEEEQEAESQNVLYSSCHETFLKGELKDDPEEQRDIYRYVKEDYLDDEPTFENESIIHALQANDMEKEAGDVQTVISEIVSTTDLFIEDVPCIEFILYNKEEDIIYARVWNTLLNQWDEKLENQLNEKERLEWRKTYLDG